MSLTVQSTSFNYPRVPHLPQAAFLGEFNLLNKWAGTSAPTELWRGVRQSAWDALYSLSCETWVMWHSPHRWERPAPFWMVPFDTPPRGLRCNSLSRNITQSLTHKSGRVSNDVTSRFRMFHAVRTGYLWSLVKLPGACLRLKLHRTRVALAPHPVSGQGGNKKDQVRSWKVSDWKIVGAYPLAWCLHWSVRRCCTLLGWLQILVLILLKDLKTTLF